MSVKIFIEEGIAYKTKIIESYELDDKICIDTILTLLNNLPGNSDIDSILRSVSSKKSSVKKSNQSIIGSKTKNECKKIRIKDYLENDNEISFNNIKCQYKDGRVYTLNNNMTLQQFCIKNNNNKYIKSEDLYKTCKKFGYKGLKAWIPLLENDVSKYKNIPDLVQVCEV